VTAAAENFDYIVVGAGSAGSVVAARLAEDSALRILVLEAGPTEEILFVRTPGAFVRLIGTERSWIYKTEAEPHANGRTMYVPQGRMPGGGSSINAMVYIRGQRQDYDDWRAMGCAGWGYDDVLPYFKRAERNTRLAGPYHGTDGPLSVTDTPYRHPLSRAFVQSAQEAGLKHNDDFNGESQLGVGFYQVTQSDGERGSTAARYLRPAMKRGGNIELRLNASMTGLVMEGNRVGGVSYAQDGVAKAASARAGVILSAGTLATPKLLMLSGIGPGAHLQQMGVPVVKDLPGVGSNYQDHLEVSIYLKTKEPISLLGQDTGLNAVKHYLNWRLFRKGLLTCNVVESGGFIDLDGDGRAELQFHVLPVLVGDADRAPLPGHGLSINPCFIRPKSRGMVRLRSNKGDDPILFQSNSLAEEADVRVLVEGLKWARKIARSPTLAKLVERELSPSAEAEVPESVLVDHVRQYAKTVYHPAGTCKMGTDALSVVDPRLAVHGVPGLWVADASVMPTVVSGNTNAPSIMIGERCADFVRGRG
jgi:choline dehydrogenase-like flavoprotein